MPIGVNEPGISECIETWCNYEFWGSCHHTYSERILGGVWGLYILLFMIIIPIIGLIIIIANGIIVKFFMEEQPRSALSTSFQIIGGVNIITGIVALLHTATYFTQSIPCNSQPVETKVTTRWIRFQIVTNILFLFSARVMPLLVFVLASTRALELWARLKYINYRIPLLIAILYTGFWISFLLYGIQFNTEGSNIYAPLFAITERSSKDWAFYYFIFADWIPVIMVTIVTLGNMALVAVSAGRSKLGWVDRVYRLDMHVLSLTVLHVLATICQAIGFCIIINRYANTRLRMDATFVAPYCLAVISVFIYAAVSPLLAVKWNRDLWLWLSIGWNGSHVYDTLARSDYSTAQTDISTRVSFAQTLKSVRGDGSTSELTDLSTLFQPGSTVVGREGSVTTARSYKTEKSSDITFAPSRISYVTPSESELTSTAGITDLFLKSNPPTDTSAVSYRTDRSSNIALPPDSSEEYTTAVEYERLVRSRKDTVSELRREQAELLENYRKNLDMLSGYSTGDDISTLYCRSLTEIEDLVSRASEVTSALSTEITVNSSWDEARTDHSSPISSGGMSA